MTIEARPGAEYAIGMKVEKLKYGDFLLVDRYIRSLNILRPQRGGRVSRARYVYRDEGEDWQVSRGAWGAKLYRTRAQAAQAVWEEGQ